MPKNLKIKKVVIIGSGPIVIGQAAEFDYAGTQACISLKEEGYEVILINSNPATIMTEKGIADKIYIEPLSIEFVEKVLRKEEPDAILPTMGGQTALNLILDLNEKNILKELNIKLLGTSIEAIKKAEDRELFKNLMNELKEPIPASTIVYNVEQAKNFANEVGFPLIVRPAFTLGGSGGGICNNIEELTKTVSQGIKESHLHKCLLEQSIAGYKEIEYEVIRDSNDNTIIVCNMENFDPVGIHTGDSIVFAPCQTLSDIENQLLRDSSLKIIRALKIEGGCNIQFALDPNSFKYYVIEVNPRVSRSSSLASKATGYPIAKVSAKIAVGLTLDEILNPVTKSTMAFFEPTLDYVVTKIPRWPFDKFNNADFNLTTQMKSTGEVMAIGRTIEESFLKAIRSLEINKYHIDSDEYKNVSNDILIKEMSKPTHNRVFIIAQAIRNNISLDEIHIKTKIDLFFLSKLKNIIDLENELVNKNLSLESLKKLKKYGFSDYIIAKLCSKTENEIYQERIKNNIIPVFKMIDTCSGEFKSVTPYFYSTYELENESIPFKEKSIIVLGSGPIRIGQGIEFDYATVKCVEEIRKLGYKAIVINSNPETVSTDFSISDKLFFEPLTIENVMNVINYENPYGVIVQFGGQTAINLADELVKRGVKILGTKVENIDEAEDRDKFEKLLSSLNINQPIGKTTKTKQDAIKIASEIGYPVLLRPSYVLGGKSMQIVYNEKELKQYIDNAIKDSESSTLLVDRYILGDEYEVDLVCDGNNVLIPGIIEHIEKSGVHSGDSMAVYPPQKLSNILIKEIITTSKKIALSLNIIGIINIQFIIKDNELYIIEVNPRSSRTVPFLSKITGINLVGKATQAMLDINLNKSSNYKEFNEKSKNIFVKAPVFSFMKLKQVDTDLGPEMKSTGEAMGWDSNYYKALYKAFIASNQYIPKTGSILFTIGENKEEASHLAKRFKEIGFKIYATKGTRRYFNDKNITSLEVSKIEEKLENNIIDFIKNNKIDLIVNTKSKKNKLYSQDDLIIRRSATESQIPLFTSLDTVNAILEVLEYQSFRMSEM
ncbi:carbamoyl-phosphate synthase large subunit [Spiroplasma turonicum]|uniref:Carbamoyl phosphate synthase large chain n=1 Tax=Spiroplasma turonicum TaxID=216946 RepID=A0A0K1P6W7_9MOLU|nr:carbamoyl-phosphate synthase large subunit [Spiroplasma turonicum]AKU80015.1 Acetyl-CoA carboxylase, biotin carboxylase [Spiroplasma turonicum]ALX71017.1 carbamoyl-phosphate synthase large subunit [Spiroplasma turonicum]